MELITGTWWALRKALFWVKEHQRPFKSAFCFLCYKNTRLWLSAVTVLHWVDFGVQRKYVNSDAFYLEVKRFTWRFYLEEKPWPGCRMVTKPRGGREDWANRHLSEHRCLGLCWERDQMQGTWAPRWCLLVDFSGTGKAERREDSSTSINRNILLVSLHCYTSIALRRQCRI